MFEELKLIAGSESMNKRMARGGSAEIDRNKVVEDYISHLKKPGFYSKGKGCCNFYTA